MKEKSLVNLVAVAVVLVAVAFILQKKSPSDATSAMGRKLLPGLPINDITNIEIRRGGASFAVSKVNDQWVAPSRYGYPANFDLIKNTLLKLERLEIGQVVKANDDLRNKLGLNPDGTGATIVEMRRGSDKAGSIMIGATRTKQDEESARYGGFPAGQYVSPDDGRTVFLVAEVLTDLTADARRWLKEDIVNIAPMEIAAVTITDPDGATVSATRPADGQPLELAGLRKNEEADQTKVSGLDSALSYLRIEDVADPAMPDDATGLDKPFVYEATTKSGEIYRLRVSGNREAPTRYMRLEVALAPEQAPPAVTEPAPASDDAEAPATPVDDSAARAAKRADQEANVRRLNESLGKWLYVIPNYRADTMTQTRATLVSTVDPKEKQRREKEAEKAAVEAAQPGQASEPVAAEGGAKPAKKWYQFWR